jgi:hypothetical protein
MGRGKLFYGTKCTLSERLRHNSRGLAVGVEISGSWVGLDWLRCEVKVTKVSVSVML